MPRIRELLPYPGRLSPGRYNAITDVEGVAVGHYTLRAGEGPWQPGHGPFRTGVTLILPHRANLYQEKVPAAVHTINGFGKPFGFEQVRELGTIESPIALTGTLNVPRVADALTTLALKENPHIGVGFAESGRRGYASYNPLVGETNDGYLSDMQARPIGESEVAAALRSASSGRVPEGTVGAGTGTSCFGWKGGIGTASRVLPAAAGGFTVGALVQTNFGQPTELTILGFPIGHHLTPPSSAEEPSPADSAAGSIMIVLACDAPLGPQGLRRLSERAAFGLARTGSTCQGGSGDFVISFSNAYRIIDYPPRPLAEHSVIHEQSLIDYLGLAVVEAVEEAIYNSLLMAETVTGRDNHTRVNLPAPAVRELLLRYRPQP